MLTWWKQIGKDEKDITICGTFARFLAMVQKIKKIVRKTMKKGKPGRTKKYNPESEIARDVQERLYDWAEEFSKTGEDIGYPFGKSSCC